MFETTVCTFHLNIPFDEWVNKFDKDEVPAREDMNIKVLFRGICKDNLHKAIVFVQAKEGVLCNKFRRISKHLKKNGADMSTAVPSLWT